MMDSKIYQMIFNEIFAFLPADWEKTVIHLVHGEEAYSYSFFVKSGGQYIKCFDLTDISEEELFAAFSRIEKKLSEERGKLQEQWSNMTMIVDNNGNMNTEFDFKDLSNGMFQYMKSWKKKYLV